jgi:hypothetical protein
LEESEPESADDDSPDDAGITWLGREQRQQDKAEAQHAEPNAAENSGRIAVRQSARDRRDHRNRHRPRGQQEPGFDLRAADHVLEIKR